MNGPMTGQPGDIVKQLAQIRITGSWRTEWDESDSATAAVGGIPLAERVASVCDQLMYLEYA